MWSYGPRLCGDCWAGPPSNLCDTLSIAYNGRFQEELGWYLIIGGGCKVVICCNPSCSRRFLGGRSVFKVSWAEQFLPKYHVAFSCSLVFLSLGKNVPTLIYSFVNGLVVMRIFHLCVGPVICRISVALWVYVIILACLISHQVGESP